MDYLKSEDITVMQNYGTWREWMASKIKQKLSAILDADYIKQKVEGNRTGKYDTKCFG